MPNTRRRFQQLSFAMFLLCSMPANGKPVDGDSDIRKRSVSEHQFMHDKGRSMQEFQRRIWLHNVMGELHTAENRDMAHSHPSRNTKPPASWPDPPDLSKLLLIRTAPNNEGTRTPLQQMQETDKPGPLRYQNSKKNGKKKKKRQQVRNGKRRAQKAQEKNKRNARSAGPQRRDPNSGPHLHSLLISTSGQH
ncbi:parathyroid hormone-related protein [Callorhinchus milii]|uniref:Parathyroid hormone like hormone n=1 Tax=Callorhinchus milii TaxID=7868 RepID=D8X185_CALMI|nr:parathyroid hormone-related protein [Callorhinchus milii]XP_007903316.1 parathyroid hormone-related protein [Callorhinchus milii]XP_042191587.1 parathyroid hormone-related protein [Callorhinchus milii]ADJ21812.1 parathyroid hormone-related protein [Callorhinchus milii]|eukprot:gi/632973771/ref/XP_007903315.1/ PREDICTED: parathyroid hormone-related protein [Callorhinchus milii]